MGTVETIIPIFVLKILNQGHMLYLVLRKILAFNKFDFLRWGGVGWGGVGWGGVGNDITQITPFILKLIYIHCCWCMNLDI